MSKIKLPFIIFGILAIGILTGCASAVLTGSGSGGYQRQLEQDGRSLAEIEDDARITSAVNIGLVKEKTIRATDIEVSTLRGSVTLKGTVSNRSQLKRAVQIAASVPGVGIVMSLMVVTNR